MSSADKAVDSNRGNDIGEPTMRRFITSTIATAFVAAAFVATGASALAEVIYPW
jgi:hypothetical protein